MLVRPLVADVHVACCVPVLLLEGLGHALTSVLGIRFLGGLVARHLLDHSDDFLVHGHDHDEGGRAESPHSADRRPDVEPVVVEDVCGEHRARPDADEEEGEEDGGGVGGDLGGSELPDDDLQGRAVVEVLPVVQVELALVLGHPGGEWVVDLPGLVPF